MNTYLFYGVVLPERAQLSLDIKRLKITFEPSNGLDSFDIDIKVTIILNQIAAWVYCERTWEMNNIHDLKHMVLSILQSIIYKLSYIRGYAYDITLTRVLSHDNNIDHVFGIDIPCISNINKFDNIQNDLDILHLKSTGENGYFLDNCFTDLNFAMKHVRDTGFFCYRAIESLRHHCAASHNLSGNSKSDQWKKFREVTKCEKKILDDIKDWADPVRHGNIKPITDTERAKLFTDTWSVVDSYLQSLPTDASRST